MNKNDPLKHLCEVCGATNLHQVLDLGMHPMCDDLIKVGDSRSCCEYPIEILYCSRCRTAHQRHQIPKHDLFPRTYHYRSRFTADVLNGMASLVDSCAKRFGGIEGKKVVDIGCNDGSLLGFFREKGATTIGIEPTDACLDARSQGHVAYNGFFAEKLAAEVRATHGIPDIIVFTNVFAHIENLPELLRSLKILIGPQTVIVIENHYLGAVLDGNQFDTFYHEHPRTYSATSFRFIAESLGLPLSGVEFPARYGGNIRVFMGGMPAPGGAAFDQLEAREAGFHAQFATLRDNIGKWRHAKKAQIADLVRRHGKLRAKAFPGRAAILVKLLELDKDTISTVHEKPGSMKIGHYLPGTRIPITSDDELFALPDKSQPILNLAWHIPTEIRGYLTKYGHTGPVIDVVAAADFAS